MFHSALFSNAIYLCFSLRIRT